jgi:TetR/AcrR family transcriptional repressor of nem operon
MGRILKLFADVMADLPNGHPGCIMASYVYQDHLFSRDVRDLTAVDVLKWRKRFGERLELIAQRYPPRFGVNLETMADMLTAVVHGGIILSKTLHNPSLLPGQIVLYRALLQRAFLSE